MLSVAGVCVGLYGDLPLSIFIHGPVVAYSSHLTFRSCRAVDSFTTSTRHSVQVIFYSLPSVMSFAYADTRGAVLTVGHVQEQHRVLHPHRGGPLSSPLPTLFSLWWVLLLLHPHVPVRTTPLCRFFFFFFSSLRGSTLDSSPASAAVRAPLLVWWTRPLSCSMRKCRSGHGYVSIQVCSRGLSVLTSSRLYLLGSQHRLQPLPLHARLPGSYLRRAVLRLLPLLWSRDRQAVRHFVLRPASPESVLRVAQLLTLILAAGTYAAYSTSAEMQHSLLPRFAQRHHQPYRSPASAASSHGCRLSKAATKMAGSVGSVLPALLLGRRRTPAKSFTTSPSVAAKPHVSSSSSFSLHGHDERGTYAKREMQEGSYATCANSLFAWFRQGTALS